MAQTGKFEMVVSIFLLLCSLFLTGASFGRHSNVYSKYAPA